MRADLDAKPGDRFGNVRVVRMRVLVADCGGLTIATISSRKNFTATLNHVTFILPLVLVQSRRPTGAGTSEKDGNSLDCVYSCTAKGS